jgi:hypothetical protein
MTARQISQVAFGGATVNPSTREPIGHRYARSIDDHPQGGREQFATYQVVPGASTEVRTVLLVWN